MKKLINILTASILVFGTTMVVVSCIKQGPPINPLSIGKGIKKVDGAVEYKNGTNNSGKDSKFTNYFIVGDSLSDVDGITTMLKNKFSVNISDIEVDFGIPLVSKKKISFDTDFNLVLGDQSAESNEKSPSKKNGYGFSDKNNKWHSSFSNGPTAGYLLNNLLGFEEINASNKYSKSLDKTMRNYSIGGATAISAATPAEGFLLDDVTIDRQARTLISQHHVEQTKNDIVFLEIGGNDLFALGGLKPQDTITQNKMIKESMEKIKIALFTLLNNGIENVIVGTPPDVSVVPRYNNLEECPEQFEYIEQISKRYNNEMINTINYVSSFYPDQVRTYDIYSKFDGLKERHNDVYEGVEPNTNTETEYSLDMALKYDINFDLKYKVPLIGERVINLLSGNQIDGFKVFDYESVGNAAKLAAAAVSKTWSFNMSADIGVRMYNKKPDLDIDSFFFSDFVHPTRMVHELVAEDLEVLAKELDN
ncbi:SGNH/GDSL hydrolase family protein [Spiroplasma endosymbiont of Othius punctulatus]|uniref:SGNH/GDSL hydrolase family protein n=1 Tax=Spiroplasma endosymbiont of Othius punctulatus TaxID=3066289 RepID=UPI0030CA64C2